MTQQQRAKQISKTREILKMFFQIPQRNCLGYEFVMLKLGCTEEQACEWIREVYKAEQYREVKQWQ